MTLAEIHFKGPPGLPALWVYGVTKPWKGRWLLIDPREAMRPIPPDRWKRIERRCAILMVYTGHNAPIRET